MSSKLLWFEPKLRALLIFLLAFAAITQLIISLIAAQYFPINSIFVFLFISLGIVALLVGAEVLVAEIVHGYRIYRRQKHPSKKRLKLKKIAESWSILIGAGITLGLFILIYFLFSYFLIDPFALTNLPIYGKFTLAEVLSGIVLIIIIVVLESAIPKQ